MKIQVSSSLQGRDLAVIKSLININNIYGELCLEYVNDLNSCELLITHECHENTNTYYALDRQTDQKYSIEPDLNPRSVRLLFRRLSETIDATKSQSRVAKACSFEQMILHHLGSNSEESLLFQLSDAAVLLDKVSEQIFSTAEITTDLISELKGVSSDAFKLIPHKELMHDDYNYSESLENFKWQLGISEGDNLINLDCIDLDSHFKQVSWPNYGECEFEKEFINLSSMLCHRSENYAELKKRSHYDDNIINKFLNATLMTGHVIVSEHVEPKSHRSQKVNNPFLISLKRLFTIH